MSTAALDRERVARSLDAMAHAIAGPVQRIANHLYSAGRRTTTEETRALVAQLEDDLAALRARLDRMRALGAARRLEAPEEATLGDLFDDAIAELGRREAATGQNPASPARVERGAGLDGTGLWLDAGPLRRALVELLDNALRFGEGRVHVHAVRERGGVSLVVTGGAPERWPSGDEVASDPLVTSRAQPLGLGLAIVETFAATRHGSLRHEVVAGRPVRAMLHLPLRSASTDPGLSVLASSMDPSQGGPE